MFCSSVFCSSESTFEAKLFLSHVRHGLITAFFLLIPLFWKTQFTELIAEIFFQLIVEVNFTIFLAWNSLQLSYTAKADCSFEISSGPLQLNSFWVQISLKWWTKLVLGSGLQALRLKVELHTNKLMSLVLRLTVTK